MARSHSPGYPNFPLPKAIELIRKIYSADRRNPIDRVVAAKHCGYTGLSGAADKVLGSLAHYDLLERAGKGQARVTQTAVDILHPDPLHPEQRKQALQRAAFSPSIFEAIRTNFSDGLPSEAALKSWLMREEFLDRAISPVTKAYLETCLYLEQEKAIESGGPSASVGAIPAENGREIGQSMFGSARVGDLVQWEIDGVLQMEAPMRVRLVQEVDGIEYVAVEGSETGIPMEQVVVQERPTAPMVLPTFKIEKPDPKPESSQLPEGWKEERLIDDGGEEIFIRYLGDPTPERYTFIRDYLDFKLSRMKKTAP
ncbi:MAG: hypothetical protein ACKOPE_08750 [Novosphingobium sp.]